MSNAPTREEFDRLQGEILAIQAAIRGLLIACPDLAKASKAVLEQLERLTSATLPRALPEATLDGYSRTRTRVFPSAADLERRQQQ